MKKMLKTFGIIALVAVIGFAMLSCGGGDCTHTGAAATCTTAQTCTKCGDVMQGALGHQGLTAAFAATCTAAGNSEASGTCTRAGCIVTGTVINALGHDHISSLICKRIECDHQYALGDIGPAGGKIIYIAPTGFTMTDDGSTAYYLEAAPANMPTTLRWASPEFYPPSFGGTGDWLYIPGTGTAIGTGRKNTALILALDSTAPAALACDNYSIADFNDWFLPSRDELNQLYLRRADFGLSSGWFWSSSQNYGDLAWVQDFGSGGQGGSSKFNDDNVRAVRAF